MRQKSNNSIFDLIIEDLEESSLMKKLNDWLMKKYNQETVI